MIDLSFFTAKPLRLSLPRLFFPARCIHCHTPLLDSERVLCLECREKLASETLCAYTSIPVPMLSLQYYGRVTRKVVHSIKYHNDVALAHEMGRQLGKALAESGHFDDVDLLLPIPMTPSRKRKRGYNQSVEVCRGIAQAFPRPISQGDLVRIKSSNSQTRLSREERSTNVEGAFALRRPKALMGKHLLLVDDVFTTGSTIQAAAQPLRGLAGTRISIATLAIVHPNLQHEVPGFPAAEKTKSPKQ